MPTEISNELRQAYERTDFRVLEPSVFTLKIGFQSEALKAFYNKFSVASAGFITAWNPRSQTASEGQNEKAHAALLTELNAMNVPTFAAEGADPSGSWPAEESVLGLGLSLEQAKSLGSRFEQNAILWADADAIPQLILLR